MPSENNNANQIIINGEEVINLRSDTVSSENLLQGETAHNKAGEPITGDLDPATKDDAYLVSDIEDDIADDDFIPFNDVSDPDIIKKKTLFSSIVTKIKTAFNSVFASITGNNIIDKKTFRENIQTIEFLGVDIPDNADLDTYTTAGNYRVVSDASGETIDNLPLALCGKVVVFNNGNGGIEQFYFANHSPRIFVRTKFGSDAWTTWKELGEGGDSKAHTYELGTEIPANADLNTYVTEGVYQCELTATARTMFNLPRREAFKLIVSKIRSSNNIMQTWISYIDNSMAYRTSNNNGTTWNTWTSIYSAIDNTIHVLNVKTGSWWSQFKYFINGDKRLRVNHSLDNGATWNGDQILAYLDDLKPHTYELGTEIPSNSDFNDYKTVGVYFVKFDSIASNISNMPEEKAGKLIVSQTTSANNYLLQTYYVNVSTTVYNRYYNPNSDTWSAWTQLASKSDVSPSTVGNGYAVATVSGSAISATITGFKLRTGVIVAVRIPSQLLSTCTLNISNTGAKTISYWDDSVVSIGRPILAGDICTFMYDGTYYKLLSKDRTPTISLQDFVADTSGNMVLNWGYANNLACIKHNIGTGKLVWNYYKNGAWRGDRNLAEEKDLVQFLGTAIPANSDLNTYNNTKLGTWYCQLTATAQTISNVPYQVAFKLIVMNIRGSSNLIQWFIPYNDSNCMWWRTTDDNGTNWQSWRTIGQEVLNQNSAREITSGNLNSFTTDGTFYWGASNASNISNVPFNDSGFMWVMRVFGTVYIRQVAFHRANNNILTRISTDSGSTWTSWGLLNNTVSTYIISRGKVDCETGTTKPAINGLSYQQAYKNGYPETYGSVLTMYSGGYSQLFIPWSGTNGKSEPMYFRSKRDVDSANWSSWDKVFSRFFPQVGYAYCSTAEATLAKTCSLNTGTWTQYNNSVAIVCFQYNVPANSTLNINGMGAKPITYRGNNITTNIIKSGDVALLVYIADTFKLVCTDRPVGLFANYRYADSAGTPSTTYVTINDSAVKITEFSIVRKGDTVMLAMCVNYSTSKTYSTGTKIATLCYSTAQTCYPHDRFWISGNSLYARQNTFSGNYYLQCTFIVY